MCRRTPCFTAHATPPWLACADVAQWLIPAGSLASVLVPTPVDHRRAPAPDRAAGQAPFRERPSRRSAPPTGLERTRASGPRGKRPSEHARSAHRVLPGVSMIKPRGSSPGLCFPPAAFLESDRSGPRDTRTRALRGILRLAQRNPGGRCSRRPFTAPHPSPDPARTWLHTTLASAPRRDPRSAAPDPAFPVHTLRSLDSCPCNDSAAMHFRTSPALRTRATCRSRSHPRSDSGTVHTCDRWN